MVISVRISYFTVFLFLIPFLTGIIRSRAHGRKNDQNSENYLSLTHEGSKIKIDGRAQQIFEPTEDYFLRILETLTSTLKLTKVDAAEEFITSYKFFLLLCVGCGVFLLIFFLEDIRQCHQN
jgi:hypothetical protein